MESSFYELFESLNYKFSNDNSSNPLLSAYFCGFVIFDEIFPDKIMQIMLEWLIMSQEIFLLFKKAHHVHAFHPLTYIKFATFSLTFFHQTGPLQAGDKLEFQHVVLALVAARNNKMPVLVKSASEFDQKFVQSCFAVVSSLRSHYTLQRARGGLNENKR